MLEQPTVAGVVQRMSEELNARAVVVLHENGQVLHQSGWVEERGYATVAALTAALVAAGRSLGRLGGDSESALEAPTRFGCDSETNGVYIVAVGPETWLSVLYDQPLNPGQLRMKVRRYAQVLAQLGVRRAEQWEVTESDTSTGATMRPVPQGEAVTMAKITPAKASLFGDISDAEIDELFENARS